MMTITNDTAIARVVGINPIHDPFQKSRNVTALLLESLHF